MLDSLSTDRGWLCSVAGGRRARQEDASARTLTAFHRPAEFNRGSSAGTFHLAAMSSGRTVPGSCPNDSSPDWVERRVLVGSIFSSSLLFFFFLRRPRTAPHCGLLKAREWFRERRVSFCSIFSLSLCSQIRAAIFIQVDDADTNSRHHQTHSITGQLTTQYSTPFLGKLSSLEVVRVGSALNPAYAHLAGCLPRWISFIRLSEACEGFATVV